MNGMAEPLFDRAGWWDPQCRAFGSLRSVSEFRLRLLADWLPGNWTGRVVVDLGCGGGLLGVPLAQRGARVIGVDLARQALAAAARLLRVGGHLFVNTIDRTLRSRVLAVTLGEGLGFIPRGTHQHAKFVRPAELDEFAASTGLRRVQRAGEGLALWATLRSGAVALRPSTSLAVAYAALYRRCT